MRVFRYILLAVWAVIAAGQTKEECAHAGERLRADSDRERARGAYLAASCHMPELAAEIVAQLQKMWPNMSGRTIWGEPQWAVKAMLDALIRLRQPLDDEAWEWMMPRFPTEATILMLQDAPRHQAQLEGSRDGGSARGVDRGQ